MPRTNAQARHSHAYLANRLAAWQRKAADAETEIARLRTALRNVRREAAPTHVTPARQLRILRAVHEGLATDYIPSAHYHRRKA